MPSFVFRFVNLIAICGAGHLAVADPPAKHPLSSAERKQIATELNAVLSEMKGDDPSISFHSRRGDTYFFLGKYKEAVADYQAMVKHDQNLDASHWRLGIALFFAGQPAAAAAQFEKYHSFDDVDRENGIWRYLSHFRSAGEKTAAKELLRYEKDDREPFPAVYKLFDGSLSPAQALAMIPSDVSANERDKRLFYTELYIGMHMVVKKDRAGAIRFLTLAVSRKWPRGNGFGPDYMWHVARVQLNDLLAADADDQEDSR